MWYEYLINAIIGIITGAISSWIVTLIYNRKAEEERFEEEKQLFQRYINNLRLELSIHKNIDNINAIQRLLEDEPILKTFEKLLTNDLQIKSDISDIFSNIRIACFNKKITMEDINDWNSKLLKYRLKYYNLKGNHQKNKEINNNG